MRFGVVFPSMTIGNDPDDITAFAAGVEQLGFDHLLTYDHVLGAEHADRTPPLSGPYDETHEFHEPLVLFGYLAAVTSRLELAVGVLVAPQRQTALIAKQAAEIQVLSRGRLRLALGSGWNWVEFEALGVDFARRGARLSEQATTLRRLWTEPVVSIDGEFHRIDRAGIAPLPASPIPLWFGGHAEMPYRRSAELGDGHVFSGSGDLAFVGAARLTELRADAGRGDDGFGMEAIVEANVGADELADRAGRWREAGGTHLSVSTLPSRATPDPGYRHVDDHLAAYADWRDRLRAAGIWPA